jgi:hypothetical protein
MALSLVIAAAHRGGTFGPNLGLGAGLVLLVFWLLVKSDKKPPGK